MLLDAEHLKLLLEQCDIEKCVQFFAGASESERQSVAKVAEKWLREVAKNVWVENHFESVGTREQNNAGRVAVFATCSLTVIKQVGLLRLNPIDSLVVRVLLDRRPKWIAAFAEFLLSQQFIQWVPTRLLMRSGLCEKPKHDNYVLGMTGHQTGVGGASSDMFGVILAWLVGEYGSYGPTTIRHGNPVAEYSFGGETRTYFPLQGDSVTRAMSDRARQLADRVVNRHAVQTLCAPTHAGGWIDRCVLADRACNERTLAAASDFEQVLALLRLAPDHCDKARGRVVRSLSEFLSALRFALNDNLGRVGSALASRPM